MTKLIFMSGSASKNSVNKKLAKYALNVAKDKGANVEFIDMKDFEMPLYCTDWELENGIHDNTKKLKEKFQSCDGFFISSPEYNSTFTPLVKNIIDWMSRPHEKDEPILSAYKGKVAAIASVSPGPLGGLRGLTPLRTMLSNIGVHVIPTQVAVGGNDNFDDSGHLKNEKFQKMIASQMDEFIKTATALNA
jgi:chromate reductase